MGMRGAVGLVGALVAIILLTLAPAAGAEIVYTHGTINPPTSGPWTAPGALWAMNDDGTNPHLLLSAAQLPGDQTAVCCTSLQASSGTLAFDGITNENVSTVGFGENYEGAYVLTGGKATRLSAAPLGSPGNESADNPLALTADGRVVYARSSCQNINNNGNPENCESTLNVIPDTGGASSSWDYFSSSADPPASFAADPANGGLLAYVNAFEVNSAPGNYLVISDQSLTQANTTVVAAESGGGEPAWSPSGSALVDATPPPVPFSGDTNPSALWLFSASANQTGTELLSDPSSPTTAFSNPVFVGANEIVFAAENNLWSIPTSCNPCTFPAQAHQLTTDGTAAAPDSDPSWTSQTVVPLPSNPPPPPPTKLRLTITPASNQRVVEHKSLVASFECNVVCAFAAQGGVQIKGAKKLLLTKVLSGSVAANRADKLTLKLSGSELSKIKTALKKHKKVTAEVEVAVKDQAGAELQSSKQFTVKH
jgi:hypothetical protein